MSLINNEVMPNFHHYFYCLSSVVVYNHSMYFVLYVCRYVVMYLVNSKQGCNWTICLHESTAKSLPWIESTSWDIISLRFLLCCTTKLPHLDRPHSFHRFWHRCLHTMLLATIVLSIVYEFTNRWCKSSKRHLSSIMALNFCKIYKETTFEETVLRSEKECLRRKLLGKGLRDKE